MKHGRWFLPEAPDLLGMLEHQLDLTIEGIDQFAAWAAGDSEASAKVHALEHQADDVKLELQHALRDAFTTPMEPEDLFALSHGIDWILNYAKDAIGESEVMDCQPDDAVAEMAALLARATKDLGQAVARLAGNGDPASPDPIDAAQAAIKSERRLEKVYRRAMAALLEVEDLREVMARRELYRRCSRLGGAIVDVAERIGYALAKAS
jgi:uncharacterized protein Yka (UPF0111/DUF47 family)